MKKKGLYKNKKLFLIFFFIYLPLLVFSSSAISPTGSNLTIINSSSAEMDDPLSVPAQAGNVTELNIFGYSTTQTWQGYFGNISGTIQLADGSDFVLYNWSLASPSGEVYVSTNNTVLWNNIQCFNFTATGNYDDDSLNAGATSLFGTNLSLLEQMFNILPDDSDGIDETFIYSGVEGHDAFYTANKQFTEGECMSTRVYDNSGKGTDGNFEEVLLYEPSSTSVIFTSLLEEDSLGFNNRTHDFETLVLEDGHGTDTATTTYYFFVELQ